MLPFIWNLLNIVLFVLFVSLCFTAAKALRTNYGMWASLLFVFGLLSFVGGPSKRIPTEKWKFSSESEVDMLTVKSTHVELDNSWVTKYELGVVYGKDKKTNNLIPIEAFCHTTGLISSINWKPVAIALNVVEPNKKWAYTITGTKEWKLLGATVYIQSQTFKGFLKPDKVSKHLQPIR